LASRTNYNKKINLHVFCTLVGPGGDAMRF